MSYFNVKQNYLSDQTGLGTGLLFVLQLEPSVADIAGSGLVRVRHHAQSEGEDRGVDGPQVVAARVAGGVRAEAETQTTEPVPGGKLRVGRVSALGDHHVVLLTVRVAVRGQGAIRDGVGEGRLVTRE